MKKIWFGVFFISLMWLFAIPIFTPKNWLHIVFLLFGLSLNIWAFWNTRLKSLTPSLFLLIIPTVFFIIIIPYPFNLGGFLLLLGEILALFYKKRAVPHAFSIGFFFSGIITLLQAAFSPFLFHFAARYHEVEALNPVFSSPANLLGLITNYDAKKLIVNTSNGVNPISITWEALGFIPTAMLLVGGTTAILLLSANIRHSVTVLIEITIGYIFIRFLFLIFIFADSNSTSIFWKPSFVILSFIFFPAVLAKFIPLQIKEDNNLILFWGPFSLSHMIVGTLIFLGIVSFVGFRSFQDPGIKKGGRILIDETHSNWEWTEKKYDTEWYGEQSGYNYYCLEEYLNNYYHVKINHKEITSDLLDQYDVLLIKTPTQSFSRAELGAIHEFVKKGGGLFLIGDHTNVFGTGTYLNPIADLFGFKFEYDCTYDLKTLNLSLFEPQKITLLSHPVLHHVPFFLFATSCTLKAPLFSENIIVGYGLKTLGVDYSTRNFFPKFSRTDMKFGLFIQMGGIKYKKGRVLLFTDSTVFSNFFMFMPGKPELILGSINWLNRRNTLNLFNIIFIILALVLFISAFIIKKFISNVQHSFTILLCFLLAVPIGITVFDIFNRNNYPKPEPHTQFPRVSFDCEHSQFYLPAREFDPTRKDNLDTFYVWTQRLGITPEAKYKFEECLKDNDVLVVVNPAQPFKQKEITKFKEWVQKGGKALILDDPRNIKTSTAYQLLSPFGLSVQYYEIDNGVIVDKEGKEIWKGKHLGKVQGGESLLFIEKNGNKDINQSEGKKKRSHRGVQPSVEKMRQPILCLAKKAEGMIALFGCSYLFYDENMGSTFAIPDEYRRKIYDLEFFIFRDLFGLKMKTKNNSSFRISIKERE